ncbi:MAG: universal stress protein [Ramlibacter sp.]|nr:universal stress protein [Ramlibacter sp.]
MKQTIKQLLVHLDATARSARRLEVACSIAKANGAAVTALYAVTPAVLELPYVPEAGPSVATALADIDEQRRATVRAAFDKARDSLQAPLSWSELGDAPMLPAFARQALYADLLVLGQHDPSDAAAAGVPGDFPETVMATSGKPALILPYAPFPATVGQTVALAWKPTRESARALMAAIPLLQRARRVHVLSWPTEEDDIKGDRLDLAGYLKARGIEPTWHREGGGEPSFLGELLLSRAFDVDADLLVMGCYGHSRAREWVLGGTSRTVLQSMTLPVLMAH